jgi:hypothetical protein
MSSRSFLRTASVKRPLPSAVTTKLAGSPMIVSANADPKIVAVRLAAAVPAEDREAVDHDVGGECPGPRLKIGMPSQLLALPAG